MAITNYRIDKIDGKVDKRGGESVDVKESFAVTEVTKKGKALEISWSFSADYKGMGKLAMEGALIYFTPGSLEASYEEKTIKGKKVLALKGNALVEVSNFILRRGIIESIILTKTLQLPAPIQLPSVKIQK